MYRRKVILAAAALLAIGFAFAAQPTSSRADRAFGAPQDEALWTPGSGTPMSVRESSLLILAPPL